MTVEFVGGPLDGAVSDVQILKPWLRIRMLVNNERHTAHYELEQKPGPNPHHIYLYRGTAKD